MSDLEKILQAERSRLEQKVSEERERISAANRRVLQIEDRLRHINALLGEDATTPRKNPSTLAAPPVQRVTDLAAEILAERDTKPMYYKDLAHEVRARGGTLRGANPAQALVARLVKDSRFVRPVRKGFYALKKDYPNARNIGARRNRQVGS